MDWDYYIWVFVWCFIWAHIVQVAQIAATAFVCLIIVITWLDWAFWAITGMLRLWQKLHHKIKRESNLEPLLHTPQKEKDELMEGNLLCYPMPEDEGPFTKMCPTCGERYPESQRYCIYQTCHWDTLVHRPITEPLPTNETVAKLNTLIQEIDETATKRNDITQEIDDAEQLLEAELKQARNELEGKAERYSTKDSGYTFSDQETLSLYNLYNRVREQAQKEKRAS